MRRKLMIGAILMLAATAATAPLGSPKADEPAIKVQPLFSSLPDDLSGKRMTVVEVTLAPGAVDTPHRHPGSVFAYVLSGSVRSQLGSEDKPTTYSAGQSWYEPPGARHIAAENPSPTEPARLLAVLIGDDEAELVLPDKD